MKDVVLLDRALYLIEKHNVTAYEIESNTHLSAVGIQKIINGATKKPQKPTLETIISYITDKYELPNKLSNEGVVGNSNIDKDYNKDTLPTYKTNQKGVPYYENMDVTATIATSFSDYPEAPTFYIDYEHFNDCTAYVNVFGDSMYPAYCSGEIIAVKKINNFDLIQWGEAYFIVTNAEANDMRTVKLIKPHEDDSKIILQSSNPNFKGDMIVNKKDILHLYIVKGKIRRNQL